MSPAKTAAQRQRELTARRKAAGLVLFKEWIHPDDAEDMRKHAARLAKRREREARTALQAATGPELMEQQVKRRERAKGTK